MTKPRPMASLAQERDGSWAVKITLPEKHGDQWARPGTTQKVVYEKPERVPNLLKKIIIPPLIAEARRRNLGGSYDD